MSVFEVMVNDRTRASS